MTRKEKVRARAREILARGPQSTASFAAAMWPDSKSWGPAVHSAYAPLGLIMVAGRLLGRLADEGLVERDGLYLYRLRGVRQWPTY